MLLCDIHESLCRGYHGTDFSNLVTTLLRPHRNWYYYQNDFPIQFSLFIGLLTIWRLATCIYIRGKDNDMWTQYILLLPILLWWNKSGLIQCILSFVYCLSLIQIGILFRRNKMQGNWEWKEEWYIHIVIICIHTRGPLPNFYVRISFYYHAW